MSRSFSIATSADTAAWILAIHEEASRRGIDSSTRFRTVASALRAAETARTTRAVLQLREAENGTLDVVLCVPGEVEEVKTTLPAISGPPRPGSSWLTDVATALETAAGTEEALARSRALVSTLETELAETNRGVMALYAELDDRADKLRRADELKSRFLSYASHELRTPLNGIIGLVRLLTGAAARSAEDLKQLGYIQRSAEDMREMVNDLLDLAKVEAGKLSVQTSEFNLDFVFGALRGIFRPLLQTEDVSLIFEDTSAVPSIYSDEAKVSQILRNLLSNALKFTERGTVRVAATVRNNEVEISVTDTGIGIPRDQLSQVFEEYTQVDSPLQRRVRGTGLGLPLCRKLAELLGGRVSAESEVGRGSTFTLVLPVTFPRDSGFTAASGSEEPRASTTVLIIDDREIDRYLLSRLLTAGGDYDIIQAEDAQAGIDAARRERPDLIFLDLNLPGKDGFVAAAELRLGPSTSAIPIFAVTAQNLSDADRRKLLQYTQGIIRKETLAEARGVRIHLTPSPHVTLL